MNNKKTQTPTKPKTTKSTKKKGTRKPKGLEQKLLDVQQGVQLIAKLGYNDFHSYSYSTERDILSEVKPLLGAEGLLLTVSTISVQRFEVTTSKGHTEYQILVEVMYKITDVETGDAHFACFSGMGQDATDKALPKAYTMANKYFLQKTFQLETKDGDAEDSTADHRRAEVVEVTPEQNFEKAKRIISNMNNGTKLLEVLEGIKASEIYNDAQKEEISQLISRKLDEVQNPAS